MAVHVVEDMTINYLLEFYFLSSYLYEIIRIIMGLNG